MRRRPPWLDGRDGRSLSIIAGHDGRLSLEHIRAELAQNRSNDILNSSAHVDYDRMLVGVRLLQDREVTVEEVREQGMFACGQPRDDQRPLARK